MPKNDNENKHRREMLRSLSMVSQLGLTVAACIIIGVLLGRWLDNLLNTSPWLLLLFSLLGVVAAFKSLFEFVKKK